MTYTVLTYVRPDGSTYIAETTFGTHADDYLWNLAWRSEKERRPEGLLKRPWSLTRFVSDANIAQLKERGWAIREARIALEG